MSNPNPLEVVQNLILDTLEPFLERLTMLEAHTTELNHRLTALDGRLETHGDYLRVVAGGKATSATETAQNTVAEVKAPEKAPNGATVLPAAVEEILALHRLDATPQQWVFRNGKQEQAPEGMWEVSCSVCSDHKIDWQQGDPEPPRCKTVKILTRGY